MKNAESQAMSELAERIVKSRGFFKMPEPDPKYNDKWTKGGWRAEIVGMRNYGKSLIVNDSKMRDYDIETERVFDILEEEKKQLSTVQATWIVKNVPSIIMPEPSARFSDKWVHGGWEGRIGGHRDKGKLICVNDSEGDAFDIETARVMEILKKSEDCVELFISKATEHGEDSEPDHEVGDLQDYFRTAWEMMTPKQRMSFNKKYDLLEVS